MFNVGVAGTMAAAKRKRIKQRSDKYKSNNQKYIYIVM